MRSHILRGLENQLRKRGYIMMKSRTRRNVAFTMLLCVLLSVAFAVPAFAATYSKVYGTTKDRIRVRDAASSSATTIDNIVKDRCVYILQSKESNGVTWIQVNYIGHEGTKLTGWVAQTDGRETYVRVLSATQAKSTYNVSDGKLPSKVAGAWTAKERAAAQANSDSGVSADTIREAQTLLKKLGIYGGEITGNAGAKTTAAIKEFQKRKGLSQDGVAGPETMKRLRDAAGGSSSSSSSSSATTVSADAVKDAQAKLKNMGIYSGEVTGNVGSKTTAAIKEFQKRYGPTQDGVLGADTIAKLNSVYSGTTVKNTSSSTTAGLGLGSSGTAVRELQQNLTALGYYWADITGNFGAKTETAVKAFQKAYGITQDGVAGTTTLNAIKNAMAKKGVTASSAGTTALSTSGILQLNSEGSQVTALQTKLKGLGLYSGEITGHFGEKTRDAVKAFQSKYNLTPDGVAGTATLNALNNAAKNVSTSTASTGSSSTTSSSTLTIDSTGAAVRSLQANLATLGYYTGDITGHYGSKTAEAVRKFQKAKGYAQTGTASPTIQKAIASATGTSGGTTVSGGISLREGDSGTQVTALQNALNKLGYYYGEVTGHFGSLTTKAVKVFQEDNDLTIDGVAGPKTIALINSKAGSSINPSNNSGSSSSGKNSTSKVTTYARITHTNVVLREKADMSSKGVITIQTGALMKVDEQKTVNGVTWYHGTISQDGYNYKGYVRAAMGTIISYADYKASTGGNSTTSDDEIDGMIKVTSDNVAVREGPGMDYEIAYRAYYGDTFYYVGVSGGWYHLLNGYYINSGYVQRISDSDIGEYYNGSSGTGSYKYGDTGDMVSWIQSALTTLGYYTGSISGHYGGQTEDAVKDFQYAKGLTADGIAGSKTIAALQNALSGGGGGGGGGGSSSVSFNSTVYDLDWFNAKAHSGLFSTLGFVPKNNDCYLIDLGTGRKINIHVQSAGNHLDVEPLTSTDTSKMCDLWGVSSASSISYLRRPMLIVTKDNRQIICSVYGTPHGTQDITSNNFPGQFCIHFLNSTTSGTKVVSSYAVTALNTARSMVLAAGKTLTTLK